MVDEEMKNAVDNSGSSSPPPPSGRKKRDEPTVGELLSLRDVEVDEIILDKALKRARLLDYMLRTVTMAKWLHFYDYMTGSNFYACAQEASVEEMLSWPEEKKLQGLSAFTDIHKEGMVNQAEISKRMDEFDKEIQALLKSCIDRNYHDILKLAEEWYHYHDQSITPLMEMADLGEKMNAIVQADGLEKKRKAGVDLVEWMYSRYVGDFLKLSSEHVKEGMMATDHGGFRAASAPWIKELQDLLKSINRLVSAYALQKAELGKAKDKKKGKKGKRGRRGPPAPYIVHYQGEIWTLEKWQKHWMGEYNEIGHDLTDSEFMLSRSPCCPLSLQERKEMNMDERMGMGRGAEAKKQEEEEEEVVCAICLNEMVVEEEKEGGGKRFSCAHIFHKACIEDWLAFKKETTPLCPYCRSM